jgi:hypothetical protein
MGTPSLHEAFTQNSIAVHTAKLPDSVAVQTLNHKNLNGALNLKLIRGSSTSKLNSKYVSDTLIHISGITSKQSGLVSTHAFQVLVKPDPNPTNLGSCITSNPVVQTFNKAVSIPSGPGQDLVSTRVFQTVSKAVPNPIDHISCIASTFAIQLLGKTV